MAALAGDHVWAVGTGGRVLHYGELPLGVARDHNLPVPERFVLHQNYPNPFNPSTTIAFELPSSGHVIVRIFDCLRRIAAVPADERLSAGRHTLRFNAGGFASGVYFYQVTAGLLVEMGKMMLVK